MTSPDTALDDRYGFTVSLDNNYLVVGAYGDDDMGLNAGAFDLSTTRTIK